MVKSNCLSIICLLLMFSCSSEHETEKDFSEIEIGEYKFHFPNGFKLIYEKGIDSKVGKISNGKLNFEFDYGYYSNSLDRSVDEYLSDEFWKTFALSNNNLLKEGDAERIMNETRFIGYSTLDDINYTLHYLNKSDTIDYTLRIPDSVLNVQIEVDTMDFVVYKFVRGENHAGLYAKNLRRFNNSINAYVSLSIVVNNVRSKDIEKCYKILKTCTLRH